MPIDHCIADVREPNAVLSVYAVLLEYRPALISAALAGNIDVREEPQE